MMKPRQRLSAASLAARRRRSTKHRRFDPKVPIRENETEARPREEHGMDIRKIVTLVEQINSEYGAPAWDPLRRVAIAAVFTNPLAGAAAGADLGPLIEYSLELGASLTGTALRALGASPAQLRAYTKAAVVGIGGDL